MARAVQYFVSYVWQSDRSLGFGDGLYTITGALNWDTICRVRDLIKDEVKRKRGDAEVSIISFTPLPAGEDS